MQLTAPKFDEAEIEQLRACLGSGWVTQGPKVAQFEEEIAGYCGVEHAVAVTSCTTALHLALMTLGIGPGDEVICPSMSFIAPADAIRHVGAGNPAMGVHEFAKTPRKTIAGASVTVAAPSGQYNPEKLINLGNNRWAFKPEVGVAIPKGPWDFDAYLGVWLFTGNDNFYPGGLTRSQARVIALQGHASYTFKPRLWAAIDATWYQGGDASVDGGERSGAMNNSRLGATVSFPMGRHQSLKVPTVRASRSARAATSER